MKLPEIETNRLRLRPYALTDVDALHQLWTDADVRRYLWDDEIISRAEAAAVVRGSLTSFAAHGLCQWVLCFRDAGALIGFCGFRPVGDTADVELLYGLAPAYWHRGLATEAAHAALRYGFEVLGLARILTATDAPNVQSIRVLERLGMRREIRTSTHDDKLLHFVLKREDFRLTGSTYRPPDLRTPHGISGVRKVDT